MRKAPVRLKLTARSRAEVGTELALVVWPLTRWADWLVVSLSEVSCARGRHLWRLFEGA